MENNTKPTNGAARETAGEHVPKGQPQGEQTGVKEGDPAQSRPKFGADGGKNTSGRDQQLPTANDGGDSLPTNDDPLKD